MRESEDMTGVTMPMTITDVQVSERLTLLLCCKCNFNLWKRSMQHFPPWEASILESCHGSDRSGTLCFSNRVRIYPRKDDNAMGLTLGVYLH